jgi:hypothetical protein
VNDRCDRARTVKIITGSRLRIQKPHTASAVKVVFFLASNSGRGAWSTASRICRQCHSTLMSIKREIIELTGEKPSDSYGFDGPH